jgi:hypothetical protein
MQLIIKHKVKRFDVVSCWSEFVNHIISRRIKEFKASNICFGPLDFSKL